MAKLTKAQLKKLNEAEEIKKETPLLQPEAKPEARPLFDFEKGRNIIEVKIDRE